MEFQKKNGSPDHKARNRVLAIMEKNGIYTISCGNDELNPSIRFLFPLTIAGDQLDTVAQVFIDAVKK